jgi:type II secretory pathway component PulF
MNTENVTLSSSEKLGFIGSLATMLSAGIPILDVVNSLREDAKGGQKIILDALLEDLMQGKHVHQTLFRFPQVFDKVTVNVIKASEEAGTLDVTLKDLKQTIQQQIEFSDKVKSALMYPVFIIVVFGLVLLMILVVVVPKISAVFSRLRVSLPLPTRILIFLSDSLVHHGVTSIGILAAVIAVFIFIFKRQRSIINEFLFSLPLISTLVEQIDITRFSRSLHLLLSSGLPITAALELTKDVVVKRRTSQIIANSRDMVFAGKSLSEGFRAAKGYIPSIMIKLMEAGEKTGSLDKSMQDISEYFDYQVTNTLKTLTALLEPILLVVVGFAVGGMMLAIISPIYGLIGSVGNR